MRRNERGGEREVDRDKEKRERERFRCLCVVSGLVPKTSSVFEFITP